MKCKRCDNKAIDKRHLCIDCAKDYEEIVENFEKYADHYDSMERLRILGDRLGKRVLQLRQKVDRVGVPLDRAVDDELERYQPDFLKGLKDQVRKVFAKNGRKATDQEVQAYFDDREARIDKLQSLCKLYDVNEDNRIAQTEITKTINGYLERVDLIPEERDMYEFLSDEFKKTGGDSECTGNLVDFIQSYDRYDPNNSTRLGLITSIKDAERLHKQIQANKEDVQKLQEYLDDGIKQKQTIREQSTADFKRLEDDVNKEITRLRTGVDGVIAEFEGREGRDIETRREYIDTPYITADTLEWLDNQGGKYVSISTGITAGALTMGSLLWILGKKRKIRAQGDALKTAEAINKRNHTRYQDATQDGEPSESDNE